LELVDEDVAEATAVLLEYLGVLAEQLDGVQQQVVEVHGVGVAKAGRVTAIDLADA
jgi:hypothetical protein